jgi:stress-induced-phosphoprotein 1
MERPEGSNEMPPGVKAQTNSEPPRPSSSHPSSSAPKPKEAEPVAAEEDVEMEDNDDAKAKKEADELKAQGTVAYKSRKFDEAQELYSKAWETYSKDITYLTNLSGELAWSLG